MGGILIYGSKTIILAFENLFNSMYTFFLTMNIDGADVGASISFSSIGSKLTENLSNGSGTLGIGATLLVFILMLTMCWQFAMYIVEVVERYIVLGVLYYMSPWHVPWLAVAPHQASLEHTYAWLAVNYC